MVYLLSLVLAFLAVYFLVPMVRFAAMRIGFVDRPSGRKIHHKPVPLSGGIAIFAGVVIGCFPFARSEPPFRALLIGGGLLVLIGLLDDSYKSRGKEFSVWPRLIAYVLISFVPVWQGIMIQGISSMNPASMIMFSPIVSAIVTAVWVFALINMVNFIDGMDGLASGVCVISSLTILVASLMLGQQVTAVAAAAVAGSCLAFLVYNFYPAKIFMGDAGATFLGYTLAVAAAEGTLKGATFFSLLVPLLALGVPIMDTLFVFTRRTMEGKGLHRADNLHTHHSLMKWGLTQVQTVSFLYLIAALFSLLSIVVLLLVR